MLILSQYLEIVQGIFLHAICVPAVLKTGYNVKLNGNILADTCCRLITRFIPLSNKLKCFATSIRIRVSRLTTLSVWAFFLFSRQPSVIRESLTSVGYSIFQRFCCFACMLILLRETSFYC